ncbi:MAG: hypothetical protein V2A34_10320, partial [Lentisphaerota bacterium]
HFHPDYFGKGFRWHIPRVDQMEVGYRLAKDAFERHGRKILNATAGGKLEVFDRVDVSSSKFPGFAQELRRGKQVPSSKF